VQDGYLGAATSVVNGKVTVSGVRRGSAAYTDGLNVGDEIISVNGFRVGDDLLRFISGRRVGDTVNLLINRSGQLRELPIKLTQNSLVSYRLEPLSNQTEAQKALYKRWLYVK
jgi:predicted metalloprotease with PDZ domain